MGLFERRKKCINEFCNLDAAPDSKGLCTTHYDLYKKILCDTRKWLHAQEEREEVSLE